MQITKFARKHEQNFTKKEIDYLFNFEVKSSNFYDLPKIHKSKKIQRNIQKGNSTYIEITQPSDLKLISIGNFLIWSELNAVTRVSELLPGKNQPTDLHSFTCVFTKVIHF